MYYYLYIFYSRGVTLHIFVRKIFIHYINFMYMHVYIPHHSFTLAKISHKNQNAASKKNVNSCHQRDKALPVNDPWEVRDEPVWKRPVILTSACSESWKMTEHLNSRLELNKCNIPESEKAASLYHLRDRKALWEVVWLKTPSK